MVVPFYDWESLRNFFEEKDIDFITFKNISLKVQKLFNEYFLGKGFTRTLVIINYSVL